MDSGKFHRQYERVKAYVEAAIYILAPDETFSPYPLHGTLVDLSEGGLGLAISPMPRAVFQMLLRGQRLARVVARLPGNTIESRMFGTVVWIDFRQKDVKPVCRLGIALEKPTEATAQELRRAVEFLTGRPAPAPAPAPDSSDPDGVRVESKRVGPPGEHMVPRFGRAAVLAMRPSPAQSDFLF